MQGSLIVCCVWQAGETPLHMAEKAGHTDIVQFLKEIKEALPAQLALATQM